MTLLSEANSSNNDGKNITINLGYGVKVSNPTLLSFTNSTNKSFSIEIAEINDFIRLIHNQNSNIYDAIKTHDRYNPLKTPWQYQEKPYRSLTARYFTLDKFPTINPLIGSQTNAIFNAVNNYVCYLLGTQPTPDLFKFDFNSLDAIILILDDNLLETKLAELNTPDRLLGPFDSTKQAALESLFYCYNKHKEQFLGKIEINEYKAGVNEVGVYLWASQKGLEDKKVDTRVFTDNPFDFSGTFYFLSDQWTNESANGRSIKELNQFISTFGYEIAKFKNKYYLQKHHNVKTNTPTEPYNISGFIESTTRAKLKFSETLPYRFVASLLSKPFVILTGLTGSGKTKLAEAFSLWISEDPDTQIRMVSVGADWTNREPLLGYPNALEPGRYVKPDSRVLDLILNAIINPDLPHFLILDEMNMSHVERYFADFLSAMESSGRQISLHPDTPAWKDDDGNWKDGVPDVIELPKNLFIIGTVNIDETTYMFSPKVLDRAQVIEFRVSKDEMEEFLVAPAPVDMNELKGRGAPMGADFVLKAQQTYSTPENIPETILPFFDELQRVGAEFGYRTASEMSRFVSICTLLAEGKMSADDVIDAAIMQKLLPKVHGSRNKIEKILRLLGQRCLADPTKEPFKDEESGPAKYPASYEKIERMHRRVIADGFTSYAEA